MLEVTGQMKMPQPPLYIRYHNGISEELLVKAVETNREHGAGNPCFMNDAVTLLKLTDRGVPLTDARDWIASGCIAATYTGCHCRRKVLLCSIQLRFLSWLSTTGLTPERGSNWVRQQVTQEF